MDKPVCETTYTHFISVFDAYKHFLCLSFDLNIIDRKRMQEIVFYCPVASTTDESLVQKPILNNIKNKMGSD